MAPCTVSPRISHPFSCPHSPATSSSNLQGVKAQRVAPAFSHTNAFWSWGTKLHYTTRSCAIFVVPLPKPKAAHLPSKPLVLRPQISGHSKCAFKPLSSAHKQNLLSGAARPPTSDAARQASAEAHARLEKRSEGTSVRESEPAPGVGSAAGSDKQVKSCNICRYSKPLVDFEKTVSSEDERTEACRACLAVLRAMRPGSRVSPSWNLKLTPEEAWERAKSCTKCRLVKELRDFAVGPQFKDGTRYHCRSCDSRDSRARPAKLPVGTPQQCGKCNEVKPATEYYLNGKRPTGLNSICKPCFLEYQRVHMARLKASKKVPRRKKLCTACGQTKSVSEFGKNSRSSDGLLFRCKPCASAYNKRSRRSKYIVDDASP
jgi:hypothetical protein